MTDMLLEISYYIFGISLIVLIMLYSFYMPEEVSILELNDLDDGSYFTLNAEVISLKDYNKSVSLTLSDKCKVDAIIFKKSQNEFENLSGKRVIARGHIYLDEDEVKVKVIDYLKVLGD